VKCEHAFPVSRSSGELLLFAGESAAHDTALAFIATIDSWIRALLISYKMKPPNTTARTGTINLITNSIFSRRG